MSLHADSPQPAAAHRLRQLAAVPLVFDGSRWVVEEDPVVTVDLSGEVICEHEGHVLDPRARAECQQLKERAGGALTPTRRELADAFTRAAAHTSRHLSIY